MGVYVTYNECIGYVLCLLRFLQLLECALQSYNDDPGCYGALFLAKQSCNRFQTDFNIVPFENEDYE